MSCSTVLVLIFTSKCYIRAANVDKPFIVRSQDKEKHEGAWLRTPLLFASYQNKMFYLCILALLTQLFTIFQQFDSLKWLLYQNQNPFILDSRARILWWKGGQNNTKAIHVQNSWHYISDRCTTTTLAASVRPTLFRQADRHSRNSLKSQA